MLRPNTILGERFKIVRMIGAGGMATVYEAQHTGIGRRVAVKVLNPSALTNNEIITRFEREARAAGAIGHDNIVEVLDLGRYQKQPFIVMEFLAGESLGQRLDRLRMLPVPMSCRILDQILAALEAVHDKGIIHRDLKPENVFLTTKAGITDFVKLLDFGVSKFSAQGGDFERSDTKTGVVMGTPHYMAPEQAFGRRDVDHRVDIYAAGVLLYEMLTGTLPFDAENTADLLLSIAYHRPPPKHIRDHAPELPEELDAIVHKAIALEREQRFQDAGTFRAALKSFLTEGGATRVAATAVKRTVKRLDPRVEPSEDELVTQRPPAPAQPTAVVIPAYRGDEFSTLVKDKDPLRDTAPTADRSITDENPLPAPEHRPPEPSEDTDDDARPPRAASATATDPTEPARTADASADADPPTMPLDKLAEQARAESARRDRLREEEDDGAPMPLVVRASTPKDPRDDQDLELDLSARPSPLKLAPPAPQPEAPAIDAQRPPKPAESPATPTPRGVSPAAPAKAQEAPPTAPTAAQSPPDRQRLLMTAVLIAVGLSVFVSGALLLWNKLLR